MIVTVIVEGWDIVSYSHRVNPPHGCAAASPIRACFETTPVPTHTVGAGSWQSHCIADILAVLSRDATEAASTLAHQGHV